MANTWHTRAEEAGGPVHIRTVVEMTHLHMRTKSRERLQLRGGGH